MRRTLMIITVALVLCLCGCSEVPQISDIPSEPSQSESLPIKDSEEISYTDATPSLAQAIKMKKFSNEGKLSQEVIESIMSEEKPNQKEKINIKYEDARKFIPANVPYDKTGDYIMKALEYYHRHQERQKDRDAR